MRGLHRFAFALVVAAAFGAATIVGASALFETSMADALHAFWPLALGMAVLFGGLAAHFAPEIFVRWFPGALRPRD